MTPEQLAQQARKSISNFCINECHAYCCRKSYLIMNLKEAKRVIGNRFEELKSKGLLKEIKDGYSLFMGTPNFPCVCLQEDMCCRIHKSKNRPQVCKDFPLLLKDGYILLAPHCPAVQENLFYPFIKKLMQKGYKLAKPAPNANLDLSGLSVTTN